MADQLRAAGHTVELLRLVTSGDRWSAAGGADATKGLFVKELEEALLDGRADLAVHSAKDVPGELPDGLVIAAVPERADARDVLIGPRDGVAGLRSGDRIGTGSPRRAAQLRLLRPDITCVEIRGNVGTRLQKLERGEGVDGLMLAAAGLARLNLSAANVTPLGVDECVPAPGQGALAIETRADHAELHDALAAVNDPDTSACVRAERAVLAGLGGGCREPVGAYARVVDDQLRVVGFAATHDGVASARAAASGSVGEAVAIGTALARQLAESVVR